MTHPPCFVEAGGVTNVSLPLPPASRYIPLGKMHLLSLLRVSIAGASSLPGSVMRTESGGDGSSNSCYLIATALGHHDNQRSTVCGSSAQLGHIGLTIVSSWLA